jgi:drug/metabolite transporter (DMT)-like permease
VPVPEGAAGFLQRGAVWPTGSFLWWTFVQAAGSLLGVGMIVKAYQIAEASKVSVFEYVILPASAAWGFLLWGETLTWMAVTGMALIALAGVLIAASVVGARAIGTCRRPPRASDGGRG